MVRYATGCPGCIQGHGCDNCEVYAELEDTRAQRKKLQAQLDRAIETIQTYHGVFGEYILERNRAIKYIMEGE
jgi:hypothetical protein